ncbi:MAG TPA: hypothetical protein VMK12_30535 [Anaeromyxobacteraceae bacterium]|nr:hypothetical protein [Anaeromyxobacteraceae bacterium]
MGVLLRQCNGLGLLVTDLHTQTGAGSGDAQVTVAEAADDVEGLPGRLFERQTHRVGRHALLDRCAHVRRRLEESVRGDETFDALMRALEVVRIDVQTEPPFAIAVVAEDRA